MMPINPQQAKLVKKRPFFSPEDNESSASYHFSEDSVRLQQFDIPDSNEEYLSNLYPDTSCESANGTSSDEPSSWIENYVKKLEDHERYTKERKQDELERKRAKETIDQLWLEAYPVPAYIDTPPLSSTFRFKRQMGNSLVNTQKYEGPEALFHGQQNFQPKNIIQELNTLKKQNINLTQKKNEEKSKENYTTAEQINNSPEKWLKNEETSTKLNINIEITCTESPNYCDKLGMKFNHELIPIQSTIPVISSSLSMFNTSLMAKNEASTLKMSELITENFCVPIPEKLIDANSHTEIKTLCKNLPMTPVTQNIDSNSPPVNTIAEPFSSVMVTEIVAKKNKYSTFTLIESTPPSTPVISKESPSINLTSPIIGQKITGETPSFLLDSPDPIAGNTPPTTPVMRGSKEVFPSPRVLNNSSSPSHSESSSENALLTPESNKSALSNDTLSDSRNAILEIPCLDVSKHSSTCLEKVSSRDKNKLPNSIVSKAIHKNVTKPSKRKPCSPKYSRNSNKNSDSSIKKKCKEKGLSLFDSPPKTKKDLYKKPLKRTNTNNKLGPSTPKLLKVHKIGLKGKDNKKIKSPKTIFKDLWKSFVSEVSIPVKTKVVKELHKKRKQREKKHKEVVSSEVGENSQSPVLETHTLFSPLSTVSEKKSSTASSPELDTPQRKNDTSSEDIITRKPSQYNIIIPEVTSTYETRPHFHNLPRQQQKSKMSTKNVSVKQANLLPTDSDICWIQQFFEKSSTPRQPSQIEKVFSTGDHTSLSGPVEPDEIGFVNLGQSCYMNAIIQALTGLEDFHREMLALSENQTDKPVVTALQRLLLSREKLLQKGVQQAQINFKEVFSSFHNDFNNNEQQDAGEFLNKLLNLIKSEEIKIYQDNFEFGYLEVYKCTMCKATTSTRHPSDLTLLLALPNNPCSIQFLLDNQSGTCSACKSDAASLTYKFLTLPRVLILQLLRYGKDTSAVGGYKKIDTPFDISLKLEVNVSVPDKNLLLPLSSQETTVSSAAQDVAKTSETAISSHNCQEQPISEGLESDGGTPAATTIGTTKQSYRLSGVVRHQGQRENMGHYLAEVFRPKANGWFNYNDSSVTPTSNVSSYKNQKECYVLFYSRE